MTPYERDALDDVIEANERAFEAAQAPVAEDLNSVGVAVSSISELFYSSGPYPDALPVLMHHLENKGLPFNVRDVLARCLAVPDAHPFWNRLRDLYLEEDDRFVRDGLAAALSASAREENLGELVQLARLDDHGESGVLLIRGMARVGGEAGWQAIKDLRSHPVVGKEARARIRRGPRAASDD